MTKLTREQIVDAFNKAKTANRAAALLGVHINTYRRYAKLHGVYETNQAGRGIPRLSKRKYPMTEVLQGKWPQIQRVTIKKYIIRQGLMPEFCNHCKRTTWESNRYSGKIPLELNHINGNRYDHRLSNLELLCPTCHTLTPTHCSRNRCRYPVDEYAIARDIVDRCQIKEEALTRKALVQQRQKREPRHCAICQSETRYSRKFCSIRCRGVSQQRCLRPDKDLLSVMICERSITSIGRQYGVSGNAVKKWLRSYGIDVLKARFSANGNNKRGASQPNQV